MSNYTERKENDIKYWRIDNDINGNPRYVVHFLAIADNYTTAINKARKLGGKVYRAKWFGGGIVFQSYNIHDLTRNIRALQANMI